MGGGGGGGGRGHGGVEGSRPAPHPSSPESGRNQVDNSVGVTLRGGGERNPPMDVCDSPRVLGLSCSSTSSLAALLGEK